MPIARRLAALATGVVALGAMAAPAAAHVTVNPGTATKGGYAKLAFRTPNERPDSGTVKVEVILPSDKPIQSVSVRPHPSWKVAVEKTKLATPIVREGRESITEVVSKITWTGGTINIGEFDEFEVSAGPLPKDVDKLLFKAVQTYGSGEVVNWIEEAVPGGAEPAHPAPVLKLTDAAATPAAAPTPVAATSDSMEGMASTSDVDSAKGLSVAALFLGGIGLLVGLAALLRRRTAAGADAGADAGTGPTTS